MAPAVECKGCLFKAKTAHEPAKPKEIEGLINVASRHTSEQGFDFAMDLAMITSQGMLKAGTGREPETPNIPKPLHDIYFIFYEHTPSEGFEDATVVGGK